MEASEQTVLELLHNNSPYKVPRYQRAYAWTDDQISDFVSDIQRRREEEQDPEQAPPGRQFYGAVVCSKPDPGELPGHFIVVDGQQRLTTLTLAFRALERECRLVADAAEVAEDDVTQNRARFQAQELREHFLYYRHMRPTGEEEWLRRVTLSKVDDAYFGDLLEADDVAAPQLQPWARDSHERLHSAAENLHGRRRGDGAHEGLIVPTRFVDNGATEADPATRLEELEAIKKLLSTGSEVVRIDADDLDQGYQLFITLNDRGTDLSDADLLRTVTLERAQTHPDLEDQISADWDKMLEVDSNYIKNFLKHYWSSITGQGAPTTGMWRMYNNKFIERQSPPQVQAFVQEMREEEEIYGQLARGEWPFQNRSVPLWDQLHMDLVVSKLNHTAANPLLLAGARMLNQTDFSKLVQLVGRFAFRYKNICSGNISRPQRIYYDHALKIRHGDYSLEDLQIQLQYEIDRIANDAVFREQLILKLDYSSKSQYGNIKYFLSILNDYWTSLDVNPPPNQLIPSDDVVPDWKHLHVEHIYPATPPPVDHQDDLVERSNRIENLTLWGPRDNRAARNARFHTKKPKYAQSGCAMTRALGDFENWGVDEMDQRRGQLLDFAVRVFKAKP